VESFAAFADLKALQGVNQGPMQFRGDVNAQFPRNRPAMFTIVLKVLEPVHVL
jgi:hypothetical protein